VVEEGHRLIRVVHLSVHNLTALTLSEVILTTSRAKVKFRFTMTTTLFCNRATSGIGKTNRTLFVIFTEAITTKSSSTKSTLYLFKPRGKIPLTTRGTSTDLRDTSGAENLITLVIPTMGESITSITLPYVFTLDTRGTIIITHISLVRVHIMATPTKFYLKWSHIFCFLTETISTNESL
jgi:hypothetical protein